MDAAIIDDLKQFITATLKQELGEVIRRDDLKDLVRKSDIKDFIRKADLHEAVQTVAEVISGQNDDYDAQFSNHERRIRRLEGRSF